MTAVRLAMRRRVYAALALAVGVAGGAAVVRAALDQPDAILYGQVLSAGQPAANGITVTARSGDTQIDAFTLGSNGAAAGFYALRVPVNQATDEGEMAAAGRVLQGDAVQLFVGPRAAGEVQIRGGSITRRDITGGPMLCAGGSASGADCMRDADCPGGLCLFAQPVCSGGSEDGMLCQCIGGTCAAVGQALSGTCSGGALSGESCQTGMNCDGGSCTGTIKLCLGPQRKGYPCLNDAQCGGSTCGVTGRVCSGGDADGAPCVDSADCGGGTCGGRATPTPTSAATRTPTRGGTGGTPTPTETPLPAGCAGDCNANGEVSINELIQLVNVALGNQSLSACPVGDVNGDETIAINELISAVSRALSGCGG